MYLALGVHIDRLHISSLFICTEGVRDGDQYVACAKALHLFAAAVVHLEVEYRAAANGFFRISSQLAAIHADGGDIHIRLCLLVYFLHSRQIYTDSDVGIVYHNDDVHDFFRNDGVLHGLWQIDRNIGAGLAASIHTENHRDSILLVAVFLGLRQCLVKSIRHNFVSDVYCDVALAVSCAGNLDFPLCRRIGLVGCWRSDDDGAAV